MSSYHHGNLRAALLESAIAVIGEKGVEGISLREIAKDLGVSHAAPTRHFKNKSDLLAAIVRDAYQELTSVILEEADRCEKDQAIERLNIMARSTIRWAMDNRAKFSAMTNPDVSRFADDDLKAALGAFISTLSAAIDIAKTKGFKHDVSMETLLLYSVGAALGAATLMTDDLMRSVLGPKVSEALIANIANQIVPLED